MNAMFVMELATAIAFAAAVVRYWKVILAGIVMVVLALAALGFMTVLHQWAVIR